MPWNPKDAAQRIRDLGNLTDEEIKAAENAARTVNETIGAQIRELFQDASTMRAAMQAMDLTNDHFHRAFHALHAMDDGATNEAVCLGLMMNTVMILKVLKCSSFDILDLASRAAELAQLFEEAMLETCGKTPFMRWEDQDGQ